jgi:hypothetical protein
LLCLLLPALLMEQGGGEELPTAVWRKAQPNSWSLGSFMTTCVKDTGQRDPTLSGVLGQAGHF